MLGCVHTFPEVGALVHEGCEKLGGTLIEVCNILEGKDARVVVQHNDAVVTGTKHVPQVKSVLPHMNRAIYRIKPECGQLTDLGLRTRGLRQVQKLSAEVAPGEVLRKLRGPQALKAPRGTISCLGLGFRV